MSKRQINIPVGFKDLLKEFTVATLRSQPQDLIEFALDFFLEKKNSISGQQHEDCSDIEAVMIIKQEQSDENDENSHDEDDEPVPATVGRGSRRVAVAAESFDPEKEEDEARERIVHPKTDDQRERLSQSVNCILLFQCLDEDQMAEVIDAMFERKVEPGEKVITQGEDGDYFYVIESGLYDIFVTIKGVETKVGEYVNKGSFGELALMYNTPRAATIQATTQGVVWAMTRETFRSIVLLKAFQKRQMYEQLLESVPILQEISAYERMNLADALQTRIIEKGVKIISQGDSGDEMFFIQDGKVRVTMFRDDPEEVEINILSKGDYFGELALLTQLPRAASVYAVERTKLAFLDVESFERLLGPCRDVMRRNISTYEEQLKQIFGSVSSIPELRH